MQVDQNGVCFLFLCQLGLFHFSFPLALEGVLLIRAVSPATPQGSVSQPDSDTHIHSPTHTHTHKEQPNAASTHTHPYPYHLAHTTHTQTLTYTLSSCCYFDILSLEGSGLKIQLSLSPLLNPLQLPVSPLPEVASPSHPVCHCSVKLTGDMMIEMPQT